MKKNLFSIIICIVLILGLTGCGNKKESISENKKEDVIPIKTNIEIVDNVFVYFSDKVGIINWEDTKKYFSSMNYKIGFEEPTDDFSGKMKIYVESKKDYILLSFYPKENEEVLTLLTYQTYNNQYELSINDNQHTKDISYSLYNIEDTPRNKEVESLNDLLKVLLELPEEEEIIEPIDVYIDAYTEMQSSGKVIIVINTNLPDGVKLMITLKGSNYTAQDSITVNNGTAKTTAFSNKGSRISAGLYSINVTMPLPSVQTDSVRKIIGNKGENLKGNLVIYSDFGSSYIVEKSIEVNIN